MNGVRRGIRRTGNEPKRPLLVVWRRTHKSVRAKGQRSGAANRCNDLWDTPCSSGQCVFTCATQVEPCQRLQILGTQGRMEIDIPFNAPPEQHCRMAGRMFLVEARRCYNLSLVISTRFKDSRRSIFEKHTPGYGVTGPGGGLCQEHGGNRGNFPLS